MTREEDDKGSGDGGEIMGGTNKTGFSSCAPS